MSFPSINISRTPLIFSFAVIANLLIFYFIMQLVSNDRFRPTDLEAINLIDFIRVKDQIIPPDEIQDKKELDEPPPPEEIPPPPEMIQPEITKPDVQQLELELPNLEVPLNIEGTPYLGDFLRSAPATSDAVSASAKPTRRPGILTDIKPTMKIQPQYPRRALRSGIEGVVVVEFTITKDGKVKDPVIIKSDPPESL